jgi:hypothetical protein
MTRTTLDIDGPILEDLKRIGEREGKSIGRTASDLLSEAISRYGGGRKKPRPFRWIDRPMNARVDLADKEAVRALADRDLLPRRPKSRS